MFDLDILSSIMIRKNDDYEELISKSIEKIDTLPEKRLVFDFDVHKISKITVG